MKFKLKSDKNRHISLNMDRINVYASRYNPHTEFEFEIVRRVKTKSDPMRKYYFSAVIKPFMENQGYEPEEEELFHTQLKIVFFRVKPDKHGIYRNVPSVFSNDSDVPVPIKKKFVDWVIRKAAEYGVYIEDPTGPESEQMFRR